MLSNDHTSTILQRLFSLPDKICVDLVHLSNSPVILADCINIPDVKQSTNSVISELFSDIHYHAETLEKLVQVCDHHRSNNYSLWCDIYSILLLLDAKDLWLKIIKRKPTEEIDMLLRGMVLLLNSYPGEDECDDDEDEDEDDVNNQIRVLKLRFFKLAGERTPGLEEFCARLRRSIEKEEIDD